jgi:hypothetical protein
VNTDIELLKMRGHLEEGRSETRVGLTVSVQPRERKEGMHRTAFWDTAPFRLGQADSVIEVTHMSNRMVQNFGTSEF